MIKPLAPAVAEIERLPEDEQHEGAELLAMFAQGRGEVVKLDDNERKAVREALQQLRDGDMASSEEIEEILHTPWRRRLATTAGR